MAMARVSESTAADDSAMPGRMKVANAFAALALFLASLVSLWLSYFPSGLDGFFGDDDFEPLSGFILVGITVLACLGLLRWSRLRWLGIGLAALGTAFWVLFVLNTDPPGPSLLLAGLYVIASIALLVSMAVEPAIP
jgi:hypothetical protein